MAGLFCEIFGIQECFSYFKQLLMLLLQKNTALYCCKSIGNLFLTCQFLILFKIDYALLLIGQNFFVLKTIRWSINVNIQIRPRQPKGQKCRVIGSGKSKLKYVRVIVSLNYYEL